MPAISWSPMHAAKLAAIYSSLQTPQFHPIMEPSSILPTSSSTSWHLPQRLNSVHSTSQPTKPSTSASSSKNWGTNNQPRPSKLTTPWLRVSSMARSNQNAQKP
eukprot:CCRYP_014839-RC/>CCRYP_014839-RC protein AED:0.32 eAED:0.32 QI:0/-1/0/1/-1/0/1/0/103